MDPDPAAGGAPTVPARPPTNAAPPPPRKKGRGCFATGCLLILALLLVGGAAVAALALRVPAKLGIWPSAEAMLDGTPDRAGAAAIVAELTTAGVTTKGLTLYVLPVRGQAGTIAYAILDTSAGFTFPKATVTGRNPLPEFFVRLTTGAAATSARVSQVAIEYRDLSGQTLGTLTARRADISAFASGAMTEQAFADALHGTFNPAAALTTLTGGRP